MKDNLGQETLESMSQAEWYNKWILKKFERFLNGKILEIGCGIGNFTKTLVNFGDVFAIDIDKNYIHKTDSLLRGRVSVGYGDIEKGDFFFKGQKFNSIVCLNVLEHIRNDTSALNNLFNLLEDKGILILLVPIHRFLYGEIDQSIGHFRRYEKKDLTEKLKKLDFSIIKSRKLNFLGAIGWYIAGKILKENIVKRERIKIFNLIAPLIIPFEDLIEPPIGTSVLFIAQKI